MEAEHTEALAKLKAEWEGLTPDEVLKKIEEFGQVGTEVRDINARLLAKEGPADPLTAGLRFALLYVCWNFLRGVSGFTRKDSDLVDTESPDQLRILLEDLYYAASAEVVRTEHSPPR